jgi:hypothetical protein
MPCNSDYMNPTRKETDSQKCAQHLCYLFRKLKKPLPDWITKAAVSIYGSPDHLNDFVILICDAINGLTKNQIDKIIYDGKSKDARALADFWDEHVEADNKRKKEKILSAAEQLKKDNTEYLRLKKKLGK